MVRLHGLYPVPILSHVIELAILAFLDTFPDLNVVTQLVNDFTEVFELDARVNILFWIKDQVDTMVLL